MTENELRRRFPNASPDFIRDNADDHYVRLSALNAKPDERLPLDDPAEREEAGWHDAAGRFEITFTVYSVYPCDWDGYDVKALQDFLVTAGILPDDGWRTLSGRVVSRKAATKDEEKTVVEIRAYPELTKETT